MTREELTAYIADRFGDKMRPLDTGRSDPLFEVAPADLQSLARTLHDDEKLQFDFLCNLGGVDTGERLEVVYSIASISLNLRLDLKATLGYDHAEIQSVQDIWPAANWYEREMWELFGINVRGHGNLKRFLLPEDWDQGHPMRKDWDAPDFVRMPEL